MNCIFLRRGYGDDNGGLPPKGKALNDYTWEEISLISTAGVAAEYFSVGDRKAVKLNGTVGSLTFSNETYYAYIIGINHNSSKEGENRIHFQFAYDAESNGTNLAFIDGGYGVRKSSGSWFNMNNTNSNAGGWESSLMRTVICPAFKNALPADLKNVIKSVTKYTNNTGNSTAENAVTATTDDIFLLAEYEVYGTITRGNPNESSKQKQYDYYSAGNSKIKNNRSATSTVVTWWLRSPYAKYSTYFALVNTDGAVDNNYANGSDGFAPGFCV